MPFITLKEKGILGTIFGMLVVIWLLGTLASLTLGGTIHVLLALAFAIFVVGLIRREMPTQRGGRNEEYSRDIRELIRLRAFSIDPDCHKAPSSPDPYRLRQVA
jgi:hypothetical protein